MRNVTIQLTVQLTISLDDGVSVADVVNDMSYDFIATDGANVVDSSIRGYDVIDSR